MSQYILESFSKPLQIMSFDFFNVGLKEGAGPQFSSQENLFLEAKLPFLDPKKTNSIPIGTALDFLKFSGLRSDRIQKILKNCIAQPGKKSLTYEQMKKIFRGVALAQNDIQPSAININANIKTKMPIFYDQDSEDQGGEQAKTPPKQPPASQAPTKPATESIAAKPQEVKPQQDKLNVFQGVFPPALNNRSSQQLEKPSFAQFPPMQPSNHFSQLQAHSQTQSQSQSQKSPQQHPVLSTKIKQFEGKWNKLKTQGNKIDGGEVKNLCKKLSDRSILSRAWKLCCLNNAGSLTKGEFFIFLQMISSNKIPQQLSSEMKATIQEVDRQSNQSAKPVANTVSTPKASSTASQALSFTQLGASQLFQNFTKIQPKVVTQTKITRQDQTAQKMLTKVVQAKKQIQTSHKAQVSELRRGQQTMNNLMGELQQYITAVDTRTNSWSSQIEQLKQGQLLLNDRLNKVCMGMNAVIMKQHALIEDLVNHTAHQNTINNQRVHVLENHIGEIQQQLEVRDQQLAQIARQKSAEKVQSVEKKAEAKTQTKEPFSSPELQKVEVNEQHPPARLSVAQKQPQPQNQQIKHEQQISPEQIKQVPQEQDHEYQQRMKSKRSQVLQLIMYLTPLTQEEMPALIQRIAEYSQQELNMVYINCYQKLQARQELEAMRAAQLRAAEDEDDFSSSNFRAEVLPTQNMFQ